MRFKYNFYKDRHFYLKMMFYCVVSAQLPIHKVYLFFCVALVIYTLKSRYPKNVSYYIQGGQLIVDKNSALMSIDLGDIDQLYVTRTTLLTLLGITIKSCYIHNHHGFLDLKQNLYNLELRNVIEVLSEDHHIKIVYQKHLYHSMKRFDKVS